MLGREFLKLMDGGRFIINGMKVGEWEERERYLLKHGMQHLTQQFTEQFTGGDEVAAAAAAVDIALSFPWLLAKAEIHSNEPQKTRDDVARVERMLIRKEEEGGGGAEMVAAGRGERWSFWSAH